MKGIIFNVLEEMVVEQAGMAAWNETLARTSSPQGVFTAGASYSDHTLYELVTAVSDQLKQPVTQVVTTFGEYLFGGLVRRYPVFVERTEDFETFLRSVEDVIHDEVRKLYAAPCLPSFAYESCGEQALLMSYRSPRKMCLLAEGLIRGAARHYGKQVTIAHHVCMHGGADHCELKIGWQDAEK